MTRAIALGEPVPIGIPAVFLRHGLEAQATAENGSVLREYMDAVGYAFDWGHVVVDRRSPIAVWRFVPVLMWHELADTGLDSARIPDLLVFTAPLVRAALAPHMPNGTRLAGLQPRGRRAPHALLTLMVVDERRLRGAHDWIGRRLLPDLLPRLLADVARATRGLLDGHEVVGPRLGGYHASEPSRRVERSRSTA